MAMSARRGPQAAVPARRSDRLRPAPSAQPRGHGPQARTGRERPRQVRRCTPRQHLRFVRCSCFRFIPPWTSAINTRWAIGGGSDDRQRVVRLPPCTPRSAEVLLRGSVPDPVGSRRCDVSFRVCDRCGDITLDGEGCTCTTPYSLSEVRRRHRAAVESARITAGRDRNRARVESGAYRATAGSTTASPAGPSSPVQDRAVPRRIAAVTVSGERAQARIPDRDSNSRSGRGAAEAHIDAAPPPRDAGPALDPDSLPAAEHLPAPIDHDGQGRSR